MPFGRLAKWSFTLAVSAVAVLAVGCASTQEAIPDLRIPRPGGPVPQVTYSWQVSSQTVSAIPKEMPVYKFVAKNLDEQDFKSLASQFGMSGAIERDEDQSSFLMTDGEKRLSMNWETGKWSYGDYSKLYSSNNTNIPSDDEVARIATEYLKEKGWLPDDFRLQSVEAVTEQNAADITAPPRIIGKVAYFYRYIGDWPVLGVSRIVVHVGDNGEIVGVKKLFKDIEPAGNMSLKSVDQAFAELRAGDAVLSTDNPNVKQAAVQDVHLAYWEDAGSISDQPYLQPVYVFTAKATEGAADTFSAIVPAIQGLALKPLDAVEDPTTVPAARP